MKTKFAFSLLLMAGLLSLQTVTRGQQKSAVKPAMLEPMQTMGVNASESGLPAYLPAEWGKLVSVQRIENDRYMLFLQSEQGEIYVVRLIQRGQYLNLDTYDQGGVALVIRRNP